MTRTWDNVSDKMEGGEQCGVAEEQVCTRKQGVLGGPGGLVMGAKEHL